MAASLALAQDPEPSEPMVAAVQPLEAQQRPPPWARPTRNAGLALAGLSVAGAGAGVATIAALNAADPGYQGHGFELAIPVAIAAPFALLGACTAAVGGIALSANRAPGGGEVRLTAQF